MSPPILALPPGLHRDVPPAVYHARVPGLVSRGALAKLERSPAHYRAWLDGAVEDDDTPDLEFGRSFHCALFEPARFARDYAPEPDFGPCRANADLGVTTEQGRENKKRRDAWRASHAGSTPIDADAFDRLARMARAVREHPFAARAIAEGESELTVRWRDDETGLQCKARDDHHLGSIGLAVDLKSARDASPRGFRRACAEHGYHIQAAHYIDGHAAVGAPLRAFVFVAVEKTPPYAVGVYVLDDEAIARGRAKARQLMARLAECMSTGRWPGYEQTIQTIELPPWAA